MTLEEAESVILVLRGKSAVLEVVCATLLAEVAKLHGDPTTYLGTLTSALQGGVAAAVTDRSDARDALVRAMTVTLEHVVSTSEQLLGPARAER